MSPRRLPSAVIALRMACTALVALAVTVGDAGAEVLSFPSADGSVIDTNKLYDSTRFVGAVAVWFHQTYPISVECNPPRGCYARSQLTNYHFSCAPRYVVVVERISFDLNGEVVKHEFLEPGAIYDLGYGTGGGVVERFCGVLPDPADLWDRKTPEPNRQTPDPKEKPRKKS